MNDWQTELKACITDLNDLVQHLALEKHNITKGVNRSLDFPLRVPHAFLKRIKKGDPKDPLLLQVLPQAHESLPQTGFIKDPLEEKKSNKAKGLLHKYHGRVLILPTGACAVNCRYCFRRNFPYQENAFSPLNAMSIINYIKNNPSIYEVILSGGDPLTIKDEQLAVLINDLALIPHVKYLRFHTRFPIMIPSRITTRFTHILKETRLITTIVIHCNHPNEIDPSVTKALAKLREEKITLLNQCVLLKSINNDAITLANLSHTLFKIGVMPYYLHLPDQVQGTHHFNVTEKDAIHIMHRLQSILPGYLVPKLVKEEPGMPHKTLINL